MIGEAAFAVSLLLAAQNAATAATRLKASAHTSNSAALGSSSQRNGAAPSTPSTQATKMSPGSALAVTAEPEAGGTHFRIATPRGPIHVFRPAGYNRATAGILVYVHGYYANVDQAWQEHGLASQFAASRRNAIFIAPDAPVGGDETSPWRHLDSLVAKACRTAHLSIPSGPWMVVGHSAAYRTIVPWLTQPEIRHIILVDALYGNEPEFRKWLTSERAHKLTLIVKGTAKWADPFAQSIPYTVRMARVPTAPGELPATARGAKLLYIPSQIGHFELITDRKVLPAILERTGLRTIHRAPVATEK